MAAFQILGLLLVAAVAQGNRIIGGTEVGIAAFPTIVQVEFNFAGLYWDQQCAGCVLNSHYILSAAHCFDGPNYGPQNRRIRAGTASRNLGGITASVARALHHPTYGQNENDGDITVVRLGSFLPLSANVLPSPLMAPGFVLPAGLSVIYAGWGVTSIETNEIPDLLHAVTTTVVDRGLCALRYAALESSPNVTHNMFCAGNFGAGGQDACLGDGGGPVYFISGANTIVAGIISWGHGCGRANYPGVNTQVSSYTNWIISSLIW